MRRRFAVALLLLACVKSTTRVFLPSRENPIYRSSQAVPVLREYVRLQCPAFLKQSKDSGSAAFAIHVDTAGFAREAELTKPSGDALLDGVFGTVAAQLTFPKDSTRPLTRTEAVTVHFSCAGDSAVVRLAGGPTGPLP